MKKEVYYNRVLDSKLVDIIKEEYQWIIGVQFYFPMQNIFLTSIYNLVIT